jgi:ribonuclease D
LEIQYIATEKDFTKAIVQLKQAQEIAFDLEYDDNRHTYGQTLCLIQVADAETVFLFDPFELKDLQPLWEVFSDPAVLKVAHSSANDIMLLKKLGCQPKNILDTDIAAKILNYAKTSLAAVLLQDFEIEMDKTQQVSNWHTRPLTPPQLDYAAKDVAYLLPIKNKLIPLIEEKGLSQWLREECLLLEAIEPKENPDPQLKLKNAERLSPYHQYILKALYGFRDSFGRSLNKPSAYVINNELLVKLTEQPHRSFEDWAESKGIHGRLKSAAVFKQFWEVYKDAAHKADKLNLSKTYTQPVYTGFKYPPAEAARRKQILGQIQQELISRYGENATTLVLGQGMVTSAGYGKEVGITKKYAVRMIEETASDLGLDITGLFSNK